MTNKKADVARLFRDIDSKLKHIMRRCFEDNGITMPQGMVIGTLFKHGEMKISELSSSMGLSNSTISGIIDRLEKQEIAERIRSKEDKRIVFVKLSPQFVETRHNIFKIGEEKFESMLDKGSNEEIEKVVDGLNTLKNILDRNGK